MPTVYARALKRAVEIIGGEEELARRLMVTPSHLTLWINGQASPPADIFLKAVDIIAEHDLQQLQVEKGPEPRATDA